MGKKKNRLNINGNNNCVQHSSDTVSSSSNSEIKCRHISKSINLSTVRRILKKYGINDKCLLCHNLRIDSTQINNNDNINDSNNNNNNNNGSNNSDNNKPSLLVCLQCGNQSCGKLVKNHAEEHYRRPHSDWHYLTADLLDWKIFCYECKISIDINSNTHLHEIIEFLKGLTPKLFSHNNAMPKSNEKKPKEYSSTAHTENKKEESSQYFPVKGLSNLGNTCFFNSVLQCLAQTPYLVEVLNDLINSKNKFSLPGGEVKVAFNGDENDVRTHILPPIEKTLDSSGNFTAEFHKTLINIRNPISNEIYRPSLLLNILRKKISHCTDGGQHDSHELLRLLLELIRNEDLYRYQSIILKEIGRENNETKQKNDVENKAFAKFYENQANSRLLGVESLFRGVLESTVKCTECNNSSQRSEYFMDLSLPVIVEKAQTFNAKQHKIERLDAACNKYFPSDRKSKHQWKKEKRNAKLIRRSNKKFNNNKIRNDDEDGNEVPDLKVDVEKLDVENQVDETKTEKLIDAENHVDEIKTEKLIDVENKIDVNKDIFEKQINPNSNKSLELEKINMSNETHSEAVNQDDHLNLETQNIPHERVPCINASNNSGDLTTKLSNMSISQDKLTSPAFTHYEPQSNNISIESCLNQFIAVELLDDNNKVQCKVCTDRMNKTRSDKVPGSKSVYTPSVKQYLISQSPAILILHLKRFQSQKFNGYHKTDKHVSFPMQLDLAPFCKNKEKRKLYSLYGLIEHSGTIHGGHYVAYVKTRKKLDLNDSRWSFLLKNDVTRTENEENGNDTNEINIDKEKNDHILPGQWFYASDSRVSQIDEATVLKKQAYLLFYERVL
ncbi:ubiquitin carboxyl-terminal hydrolase 45 [Cotesia glomerata]|uniref:Ubiquitin carboxyl-terminal hydrolase n=1 Tax=Cotesia glomerata TaxID=32391 RepID=A0AAV7HXL7_COTGL|nr:ubiquitin carboxyl-terminal hydrolase 45 [Cotesia glomerata]KAH0540017.1 hypothetical protein KQX54_011213 [Cotesia glomerata]